MMGMPMQTAQHLTQYQMNMMPCSVQLNLVMESLNRIEMQLQKTIEDRFLTLEARVARETARNTEMISKINSVVENQLAFKGLFEKLQESLSQMEANRACRTCELGQNAAVIGVTKDKVVVNESLGGDNLKRKPRREHDPSGQKYQRTVNFTLNNIISEKQQLGQRDTPASPASSELAPPHSSTPSASSDNNEDDSDGDYKAHNARTGTQTSRRPTRESKLRSIHHTRSGMKFPKPTSKKSPFKDYESLLPETIYDSKLKELIKKSRNEPLRLNRLEFNTIFELSIKGNASTNYLTFKDMMPAKRFLKMTCTATYLSMLYSIGELIKDLLEKGFTKNEIEFGISEFYKKHMTPKTLNRFLFWFHSNTGHLYTVTRDNILAEIESGSQKNKDNVSKTLKITTEKATNGESVTKGRNNISSREDIHKYLNDSLNVLTKRTPIPQEPNPDMSQFIRDPDEEEEAHEAVNVPKSMRTSVSLHEPASTEQFVSPTSISISTTNR